MPPRKLKALYLAMGGAPVIHFQAPRFKDELFRLHGRQVPRGANRYWGK